MILVVGLLLVSFTYTIGNGVVYAFNSTREVWLLVVHFFEVFWGFFSLFMLALLV
jgi:hypothetical protein